VLAGNCGFSIAPLVASEALYLQRMLARVEDPVFSPRAALVFMPAENHNFRVTYNRAFSTPSSNNLFLDIVAAQAHYPFILLQPLGFLLFLVCMLAETNRSPFDLPEAESELTGGFHTEYSSMHFAMYFLAEYCSMITLSAVAATFFLGGWRGPFLPPVAWFLVKVLAFMFFFMWVRATTPRLRYDQLMGFGWKVLLPLAILNVVATAGVLALLG